MTNDLHPLNLSWTEVDPRLHVFDAACALAEVTALGPAGRVPAPVPEEDTASDMEGGDWAYEVGDPWSREVTQALVERFGRWAAGWRWVRDEGDIGGGPVGAWCCPVHSITTPAETLAAVAGGLCEWRSWLEELAGLFDRFVLDSTSAEERRAAWERGAVHLITRVVERTDAGDAWYLHCRQVLTWYLTRWDVDADVARVAVAKALDGQFRSWVAPEREAVSGVAERLAGALMVGRAG